MVAPAAGAVPASNFQTWFTESDYPKGARDKGIAGRMFVAWQISTNGTIGNCAVLRTSADSALDAAGCAAIKKRGRYTAPAYAADGTAVPSIGMVWVKWTLADDYDLKTDRFLYDFVMGGANNVIR